MADTFTPEQRSAVMARVKNRNTTPEKIVRSLLHAMGFRFRLHRKDLPGSPDIVLPRHKTVIFVHGCFWHGHTGCRRGARPTSNTEFWNAKIDRNVERDRLAVSGLEQTGWRVLTVWQCELKSPPTLRSRLAAFLNC